MKALPDNDPSLSSEERLRRTALIFEEVAEPLALSCFGKAMEDHPKAFLLLRFPGQSIDDCKKSVVCNREAHQFSSCLLADVSDCPGLAGQLTDKHGLGIRVKRPASAEKSRGCMALLLHTAAMPRHEQELSQGKGAAPSSTAGSHELQAPSVRRKMSLRHELLDLAQSLQLTSTQSEQHLRKAKVVKEVQERLLALGSRPGTRAQGSQVSLINKHKMPKNRRIKHPLRRLLALRPTRNQRTNGDKFMHYSRVSFPGNQISG